MRNEPLVSAVLVNYNGYSDTRQCVQSLLNCGYNNLQIIIVDNCSTVDGVKYDEVITSEKCQIIELAENRGFSGGNNVGIVRALENNADYILILNNDTVVEKDFLSVMVATCEEDKTIGITTGKIRYYDDPNYLWFGGSFYDAISGEYKIAGIGEQDSIKYNDIKEISFATACLWLLPTTVIKSVGYMDESYFLYYEDADYCERVLSAGYKIVYNPKAEILHKESRTTKKESNLYKYYVNRNYMYYIMKTKSANKSKYLRARFVRLLKDCIRRRTPVRLLFYISIDVIFGRRGKVKWKID